MSKTSQISARISATDKERAEEIFRQLGVTASQAITLFYRQVYLRRGIPFPVELPNQTTLEAIEEGRSGKTEDFDSVDDLMNDLGV